MFEIDFTKPVVAASEFSAGDRVVRAGEVFDWRAHGMSEVEIVPLVQAGLVRQASSLDVDASLDELAKLSEEYGGYDEPAPVRRLEPPGFAVAASGPRDVALRVTPGESVTVETPTQRDARRGKRR